MYTRQTETPFHTHLLVHPRVLELIEILFRKIPCFATVHLVSACTPNQARPHPLTCTQARLRNVLGIVVVDFTVTGVLAQNHKARWEILGAH